MNISCRSDGKEEKSEGEGKDGKGKMLGIIVSLYISCETGRKNCQIFSHPLNKIKSGS